MSVSGSTNFNETRDQIITDALMGLGVIRPTGTVPTADLTYCSNVLNKMVKAWMSKGIGIWGMTEGTLFLRNGVSKYVFPGTDNVGDDVIETTLSSNATGTSLAINDTTGITANDSIGIELDNNTRQWTTVLSVDSSTTLTLADALTSTASSGRTVFSYTTSSSRAINITSCRYRISDGTDVPIYMRGRDQFMSIPSKTQTSSTSNQVYFTAGETTGTFYLWPVPDNCASRLKFSYQRVFDDFDAGTDNADFPAEWLDAITINLQARVARTYGKSTDEIKELREEAKISLVEMQLYDVDSGSTQVVPMYRDDE